MINNQMIRQNERQADSLEDRNLDNFLENKHLMINQSLNKHLRLVSDSTKP